MKAMECRAMSNEKTTRGEPLTNEHAQEVARGERFEFGANWTRFLSLMSEERIVEAVVALKGMLGVDTLDGKTFLDIGSGSGLMSLAAQRLGARVISFDYDPQSVACTLEMRRRYGSADSWNVQQGSALDQAFLESLGRHDVVYSWGVLHHTGRMWEAITNVISTVADGGLLFIAIYNDQGPTTRYWTLIKRIYNRGPLGRLAMTALHLPYLYGARAVVRALSGRQRNDRGMSLWYDMRDWLGGYPFETAKPEAIFDFVRARGFELQRMKTCGGRQGCNEFVFRRTPSALS
jgi:2-polyprenyl-6-hydroxyphenyl methylase/3-demethylubiquinone-9 3-methyltransferase